VSHDGAAPWLSLVVPAYNEEARLPATITALDAFLAGFDRTAEVLVVDNASRDRTAAIAGAAAARDPRYRVLSEPRRGKGAAVRSGMLAARGAYRFIADADLSMPLAEVGKFLPPILAGVDVAIGSREAPGARRIGEPLSRHLMGRIFNVWVRLLALPGVRDSQCGFKCFSAAAAEAVFPLQTVDDFTFDVEILLIARWLGLRIVEVPIEWHYRARSRVRPLFDGVRMAAGVWRIRQRARLGAPRG
jgi:glycosyltransferase involved in cell wall biosynthesis